MFSESDKLQAKLYAQAQIDLDHLAATSLTLFILHSERKIL